MSYRCVQAPFLKIQKQQMIGVSMFGMNGFPVELLLNAMELLQLQQPFMEMPQRGSEC